MLVKDYGGEIDWNIGAFCGHDEMMFDIDKACKMACEKNGIRYVFSTDFNFFCFLTIVLFYQYKGIYLI